MYLTQTQTNALIAHLNRTWTRPHCELCDTNQWDVAGYVSVSLTPNPATLQGGGPYLPTAAMICKNCGNTRLVNLAIAGVYSDE